MRCGWTDDSINWLSSRSQPRGAIPVIHIFLLIFPFLHVECCHLSGVEVFAWLNRTLRNLCLSRQGYVAQEVFATIQIVDFAL